MRENGDVYLGTYEGWYCVNDETFWPESKLVDGTLPDLRTRSDRGSRKTTGSSAFRSTAID